MTSEELKAQLAAVRTIRRSARRQSRTRSRLDRYRADIETLAADGASSYDIALWLRQYKRTKVHPSTVWRALTRWRKPEI